MVSCGADIPPIQSRKALAEADLRKELDAIWEKTPLKMAAEATKGRATSKARKKQAPTKLIARAKKLLPPRVLQSKQACLSTANGHQGTGVALISSKLAYAGPLFDVYTDYVREPEGETSRRDVIRHSGSVVILAWTIRRTKLIR